MTIVAEEGVDRPRRRPSREDMGTSAIIASEARRREGVMSKVDVQPSIDEMKGPFV